MIRSAQTKLGDMKEFKKYLSMPQKSLKPKEEKAQH
jgi:hypothetical protein